MIRDALLDELTHRENINNHVLNKNYVLESLYDLRYLYGQDIEEIRHNLITAYNQLNEIGYAGYALTCIKLLINIACNKAGYVPMFDSYTLIHETNDYALKGLIADNHNTLSGCSNLYYEKAEMTDYVAYRLGRYWEVVRENKSKAIEYYEKSSGYRAKYRIGFIREQLRDYDNAYKIYEDIVRELEAQEVLEPLQIKYMIETYYRMVKINRVIFKQYRRGLLLVERAKHIKNYKPFFNDLYRERSNLRIVEFERSLQVGDLLREEEDLRYEIEWRI